MNYLDWLITNSIKFSKSHELKMIIYTIGCIISVLLLFAGLVATLFSVFEPTHSKIDLLTSTIILIIGIFIGTYSLYLVDIDRQNN